jgi:hypothetical protein
MTTQCCICLEESSNSDVFKLTCNHEFCNKCISSWLLFNDTCPCCRKEIIKYVHEPSRKKFSLIFDETIIVPDNLKDKVISRVEDLINVIFYEHGASYNWRLDDDNEYFTTRINTKKNFYYLEVYIYKSNDINCIYITDIYTIKKETRYQNISKTNTHKWRFQNKTSSKKPSCNYKHKPIKN